MTCGALPTPTRDDFTSPTEVIVHADPDQRPDGHNRIRFTAFWLTDQEWVPGGVHGQVFHSNLDRFIAEDERHDRKVRVVDVAAMLPAGLES